MRKKRVASLAIVMAMVLGLAGCGSTSKKSDTIEANAPAVESVQEAVEEAVPANKGTKKKKKK